MIRNFLSTGGYNTLLVQLVIVVAQKRWMLLCKAVLYSSYLSDIMLQW